MKILLYIPLFLLFSLCVQSQNIHFKINAINQIEQPIIDSIKYQKIHPSKESISETTQKTINELQKKGYIHASISDYAVYNDTLATANAILKNQIKKILIYKDKIQPKKKMKCLKEILF